MATIEKVNLTHIKKWEGGLSKDNADNASSNPVPDGSGFHTNMGITWSTFSGLADSLGFDATPENFKEMPPEIWLKIYKNGFWDSIKGDHIESQAIAEFMAEFSWGSGPTRAAKTLQECMNLHVPPDQALRVDGRIGPVSIGRLNELIRTKGERIIFEDMDRMKRNYLKTLGDYRRFGLGWYNRMDEFRDYAVSIIA